ncbi:alpha-hydroxy acid oxidase [Geodermatophilus sp. SYSU D00703]
MRVQSVVNLAEMRELARWRLPRPVFDMVDGGADDELTLARTEAAFREIRLSPRTMVDVASVDPSVAVLGRRVSVPVLLAPTGGGRIAHRRAELAVAAAARAHDTVYVQSTVTGYPLEEVARAGGGGLRGGGELWYQLYLPATRDEARASLDRVAAAGYRVLVLTVDTPVFGGRERDRRNGFSLPVRPRPRMLLHGAARPAWAVDFLRGNLPTRRHGRLSAWTTQRQVLASPRPVTWDDLAFVRDRWSGPLVVKGVLRADECARFLDAGVDGLVVSNHGGRQLDGVPASIEALPAVAEAVDGRVDVLLDGGVRRGTDVLKALALGARAVLVGRPYLYGLAADGQAGVERVLELLRAELVRALALTGCRGVADVDAGLLLRPHC